MLLSIEEAAVRLGKSPHQVRYMIKAQQMQARKLAGRWVIESTDLPLSEGQTKAVERKERQLRSAVEEGLGVAESGHPPRYSIKDLKAFQLALPIYEKMVERVGAEHPTAMALHEVLQHLAQGCHRYDKSDKTAAYRQARDAASLAVCEMVILGQEAEDMVTAIEQDLMAALAGLIRRLERRPSR